ncbi:MAG: hypothetical protein FWD34_02880 [Oscillospiraceae bacterium]|nr:hypothetical protein [Oscillospiraceae bacterium]
MEREYDLSKFFRNPERAKRLRENGCRIGVTRRVDGKDVIVKEYFVTPEQIAEENAGREINRKNHRVQN